MPFDATDCTWPDNIYQRDGHLQLRTADVCASYRCVESLQAKLHTLEGKPLAMAWNMRVRCVQVIEDCVGIAQLQEWSDRVVDTRMSRQDMEKFIAAEIADCQLPFELRMACTPVAVEEISRRVSELYREARDKAIKLIA